MRKYTFHLCEYEGQVRYISERQMTLADAMQEAVRLAFRQGKGKTPDEVRGHFVCVFDKDDNEVFRTPIPVY